MTNMLAARCHAHVEVRTWDTTPPVLAVVEVESRSEEMSACAGKSPAKLFQSFRQRMTSVYILMIIYVCICVIV